MSLRPACRRITSLALGVLVLAVSGIVPEGHLSAQLTGEAVVQVQANFRAGPDGNLLGQLEPGTRVLVGEQEGAWTRATLRGFIWAESIQERETTNIHGLVVSASGGENLRDQPAGRIAGRLISGTVLQEMEREPGWVEVQRTGWIWTESLASGPASTDVSTSPTPDAAPPTPDAAPAAEEGAPSAEALPAVEPGVSTEPGEWLSGGARGASILSAPDGDTLGRAGPGSELRVVSREGNWVRVQLEGWIWLPGLDRDGDVAVAEAPVVRDASARDLSREYERYRGRMVELELQFISLERAEQVRTDFYEGEPFLLTRSLDPDRTFIYVAIPPEFVGEAGTLSPLETVRVLGRLRSGAAAFTGSPILDLVELSRIR
jgi:hypothetical protein